MAFQILIVDDELNIRTGLAKALACDSYLISTASDAASAWAMFQRDAHQLVITDLKMPGAFSGLDLLQQIKHERPETLILLVTAHGTIETAALSSGAPCAWSSMTRRFSISFVIRPIRGKSNGPSCLRSKPGM